MNDAAWLQARNGWVYRLLISGCEKASLSLASFLKGFRPHPKLNKTAPSCTVLPSRGAACCAPTPSNDPFATLALPITFLSSSTTARFSHKEFRPHPKLSKTDRVWRTGSRAQHAASPTTSNDPFCYAALPVNFLSSSHCEKLGLVPISSELFRPAPLTFIESGSPR